MSTCQGIQFWRCLCALGDLEYLESVQLFGLLNMSQQLARQDFSHSHNLDLWLCSRQSCLLSAGHHHQNNDPEHQCWLYVTVVIAMGPWSGQAVKWLPVPNITGQKYASIVLRPDEHISNHMLFLSYKTNSGAVTTKHRSNASWCVRQWASLTADMHCFKVQSTLPLCCAVSKQSTLKQEVSNSTWWAVF